MSNAHLIRDACTSRAIEGIQPAPRAEGQGRQVVAGPAGIEQDHGATHCSCLAHWSPGTDDNRGPLWRGGSSFLYSEDPKRPKDTQASAPVALPGLQVDAGGGPAGHKAEAGGKRECADNKQGVGSPGHAPAGGPRAVPCRVTALRTAHSPAERAARPPRRPLDSQPAHSTVSPRWAPLPLPKPPTLPQETQMSVRTSGHAV